MFMRSLFLLDVVFGINVHLSLKSIRNIMASNILNTDLFTLSPPFLEAMSALTFQMLSIRRFCGWYGYVRWVGLLFEQYVGILGRVISYKIAYSYSHLLSEMANA